MLFHIIQEKIKGVTHFQTWLSENAQKNSPRNYSTNKKQTSYLGGFSFPSSSRTSGCPSHWHM